MEANFYPTQQDVKISPQSNPEVTEQDLDSRVPMSTRGANCLEKARTLQNRALDCDFTVVAGCPRSGSGYLVGRVF